MAYECDNREGHAQDPQPVAANKLITNLDNGDTLALCDADWLTFVLATAAAAQTEPDVEGATNDQGDETDEDEDEDQAAVNRLAESHPPAEPDPGTATVVKRGTSASRARHQAKRASSARNQLPRPVAIPAEGANLGELLDADEATAVTVE